MYSISINGVDFTKYLLDDDGLTGLNRRVEDDFDFSPVASTLNVKLSNIDGLVSETLKLPSLTSPQGALVRDGKLFLIQESIQPDSIYEVVVNDEEGRYFGGYIDTESIGWKLLDNENPNSEKVVGFTINDYAKSFFKFWDMLGMVDFGVISDLTVSGIRLVTLPYFLMEGLSRASQRAKVYGGMPDFGTIANTKVSSYLTEKYLVDWEQFGVLVYEQYRLKSPQTISSFLVDLSKRLLAVISIDESRVFHFTSRSEYRTDPPVVYINDFIMADSQPIKPYRIEYIRDVRPEMRQAVSGVTFAPIGGAVTGWYHWRDGKTVLTAGDQSAPIGGSIFDAVPSFASFQNTYRYFALFKTVIGNSVFDADTTETRSTLLSRILKTSPAFQIKVPGTRFYPYQKAIIGGIEGFRINSAIIEPQKKEAMLTIEYLGY